MKKYQKILWIIITVVAAGLFVWQFFNPANPRLTDLRERAGEFLTENLDRAILTPGPLEGPLTQQPSVLTREGIIEWTNTHRAEAGLPPLEANSTLSASAALKVQDMFEGQYFAHTAPDGTELADIAQTVGYEYVLIGENLALGNFEDDATLVQAWMDSPGHRENIMHENYTQIGIGLSRGTYEGNEVWIAVQHFGKPKSACPSPDENMLAQINANKEQLEDMQAEIEQRAEEIENTEPKRGPVYNERVREYNELVDRYNTLAAETKELTETYNLQVREFNECAQN